MKSRIPKGLIAFASGCALLLALAPAALADSTDVTATAQVNSGPLSLSGAGAVAFSGVSLDGTDKSSTGSGSAAVSDATGNGSGWSLAISATQFSSGGSSPNTLPATALTVTLPAGVVTTTGLAPTTSISSGSAVVPSASSVKVLNATSGSGMGQSTATLSYALAIPAQTYAGTYSSTLTYTLTVGP